MAADYSTYDLEQAKQLALSEVENWFSSRTQDVFDSNATGTLHSYWCDYENQMNMVNGSLSRENSPLMACPHPLGESPVYAWVQHTPKQAGIVHADYLAFKAQSFDQYQSFKLQVAACATVQECQDLVNTQILGQ